MGDRIRSSYSSWSKVTAVKVELALLADRYKIPAEETASMEMFLDELAQETLADLPSAAGGCSTRVTVSSGKDPTASSSSQPQ